MPWRPFTSIFRTAVTALSFGSLVMMSTGCSPKAPTMRVNGANFEGISATLGLPPTIGALLRIFVSGENENSFDIQIRGVRGDVIMLNGRYRLPVQTAVGTWLPSDRATPFSFTVNVPVQTGFAILSDTVTMGCIPYSFQGVADVTATSTFRLDKDNYPVSQSGCIPRQSLLMAIPGGR